MFTLLAFSPVFCDTSAMLFSELAVLRGRQRYVHMSPTSDFPGFWDPWFSSFFRWVMWLPSLAPKWGPRRRKRGPRRPETTPRPPQDPQNRGQDPPQDLKISRSNIDAENDQNFNQKSKILGMNFDVVLNRFPSRVCFLLT